MARPIAYELLGPREVVLGERSSAELAYRIEGTSIYQEAMTTALGASPISLAMLGGSLLRTDVRIEPSGENAWEARILYQRPAADYNIEFEIGGGTQRIFHSLGTLRFPVGTAPSFDNLIGADLEGNVEGVDIPDAEILKFSYVSRLTDASVTPFYVARTLKNLVGKVNDDYFLGTSITGFLPGEVLFTGVNGSRDEAGLWTLRYQFAARPDLRQTTLDFGNGVTIPPDGNGLTKPAWDYLWILRTEKQKVTVDGKKYIIPVAKAAYIERVFETGDFNELILSE